MMPTKKPAKKSNFSIITAALVIVIIIAVAAVAYTTFTPPGENTDDTQDQQNGQPHTKEPPTALTLTYQDTTLKYTKTDITTMTATTGYGGYRTSFPSIKGLGNYTGIALTDLLKPLTQNLTSYSITVIAEDGYISNYSYNEIMGNVSLYDPTNASNEEPISTGGVTLLLAYEYEGQPLDEQTEGTFKIVYIDGYNAITSSRYWARFVDEIQIISE
jgi:hypothetical protein